MSDNSETLLAALKEKAPAKKPKADELAKMAGVDKVTAEELNAAWKAYQETRKETAKSETEGGPVEAIFVKTVPGADGFRRAGFQFTKDGYGIALEALTKKQLAAIEKEPRLVVEHGTFDAAKVRVKAG